MKLPITLLLTYQAEYENTSITLDELCNKYSIKQNSLTGWQQWEKKLPTEQLVNPKQPMEMTVIDSYQAYSAYDEYPESQRASMDINIANVPLDHSSIQEIPEANAKLLSDISEFKELAVSHALDFIKNNAKYAETKEIKDVVAIVDSIEKSFTQSKQPQGPTVHIAIQNLVERFRDDC